jgi:hypothetical protein
MLWSVITRLIMMLEVNIAPPRIVTGQKWWITKDLARSTLLLKINK